MAQQSKTRNSPISAKQKKTFLFYHATEVRKNELEYSTVKTNCQSLTHHFILPDIKNHNKKPMISTAFCFDGKYMCTILKVNINPEISITQCGQNCAPSMRSAIPNMNNE